MPEFVIYPEDNPDGRWRVQLGDCSQEHADSVLAQLEADPSLPNNLALVQAGEEVVVKKSLLRRIFGG
jgi:hypothetical protein